MFSRNKIILFLFLVSGCVSAKKPQAVQHVLDGSKSYDTDGTVTKWVWNQLNGRQVVIQDPNSVRTIVTFIDSATIQLTVIDNDGAFGRDTIKIKK